VDREAGDEEFDVRFDVREPLELARLILELPPRIGGEPDPLR
jgi:hypothetical protein